MPKVKIPIFLRKIVRGLRLLREFYYDYRRYYSYSNYLDFTPNENRIAAEALRYVHSLEKGLVMPSPKRQFGTAKIHRLDYLNQQMVESGRYEWVKKYIEEVSGAVSLSNAGMLKEEPAAGTINIVQKELVSSLPSNPLQFFANRRSIRNFIGNPLTKKELNLLVACAQSAPSVCNRQGGRVRFFNDEKTKKKILALQNGNAGFGHLIPTLAVISSNIGIMHSTGERNQAWIDGGLFAMTLSLASHAYGFGSCFLNWSENQIQDEKMRALLSIPDDEVIISLLAIGRINFNSVVAESRRRPMDEIWLDQALSEKDEK